MCGLVGIVGKSSVNQAIYDALTVLQHRGQDAAGIMTFADGNFHQRKSEGLVRDVFRAGARAALLRQFTLRHRAGPQRQPDQLGGAQ